MSDLLEPLVSTIETIKDRIDRHGASLRQNETRTRAALIDPLLQALGWDTTDPALVTPEYRTGGWADYALIGPGNRPAAIIEAKRLGSVVENHLEQAVGYCIQEGIAYAGVTDGSHWQIYRTFEPVPLVQKLVLDVDISVRVAHESALKMLLLWRPNLSSGHALDAATPAFLADSFGKSPNPTASNSAGSPTQELPKVAERARQSRSVSDAPERGWKPLSEVLPKPGDAPPTRMRTADGSDRELRRAWIALLEGTAEWLWSNDFLTINNVPIQSSGRRNIVNIQPFHPEGNSFTQPWLIEGTPLWVERNISAQAAVANSKTLLEQCGVPQDEVSVWFE